MIQLKTMVNCIDNSGAAIVECINILKSNRAGAKTGDRIVVVVQKQRFLGSTPKHLSAAASAGAKVKRGDIRHAVVVRTAKKYQRPDGSVVKFDDNACVLVSKSGEPIGTRVTGVVGGELKRRGVWGKILSLAPCHV